MCQAPLRRGVLLSLLALPFLASCALSPVDGSEARGAPPLYRKIEGPDRSELQVLWPIFKKAERPGKSDLSVAPLFWRRELTGEDGQRDLDWAFLPFLLAGEDDQAGDHFLFFPFWGNTRELLGKDEMRLRMFPLYMETTQGGYETKNALWPLVSWGEGEGRSHLKVLPFYSRSDAEGKSWSRSVMWPLVSWGEERLHTDHPSKELLVFPFYGESSSDQAWTRTYLFPFFTFSGNEAGYRDTNLLWPVYRRMEAPDGRSALRVWPFYSRVKSGGTEDRYWLWPFFWRTRAVVPEGGLETFQIVPFYRRSIRHADPEERDGSRGRETQIWPLVKRSEDAEGGVRTTFPAPIPFSSFPSLEGNYGWIWTLYEHVEQENREKVSVLGGLFGYEREEERKALRLLWFIEIPIE